MIIVKATKRRYKTCAIGCIGSGDTEVFSLARRILDERIARWRQRTADRKGGSLSPPSRGGVRRRPGFTPPGAVRRGTLGILDA